MSDERPCVVEFVVSAAVVTDVLVAIELFDRKVNYDDLERHNRLAPVVFALRTARDRDAPVDGPDEKGAHLAGADLLEGLEITERGTRVVE